MAISKTEQKKSFNNKPYINQTVIIDNLKPNEAHNTNSVLRRNHKQAGLSSVSATTTNIEQQTAATRMSSGYFSGDEFRSYYKCNDINIGTPVNQPQHRSNQFDINKFLNNNINNCLFLFSSLWSILVCF